jgi:hypothetical protein
MSVITRYDKGSELSWNEMDGNFNYLNSWDKSHIGGNITYVPLTKEGYTQTEIINNAISVASAGDTLILASGTYNVVATIVINQSINLLGQGMQATIITCDTHSSDTIEITTSNVTLSNMTINNTGHDTTAIWIYPESPGNLSGILIENIRINSYVAYGAEGTNLGILSDNSSVDIHDCEITVSTVNISSAGISLYIDMDATSDINCVLTNNTITVNGGSSLKEGAAFGNEGIRVFCSLHTTYLLNVNMFNVDSRATTAESAVDYGIRVTSETIDGHATEAFNATVNAYNCLFSGTTKDARVYGLNSESTNKLNLYGCTLVNGTPQGIGGDSGLPGLAVNNLGIIAAKGIQVADNTSEASAFNQGTLRYRVAENPGGGSGDAYRSYCEMSMQTGTSTYSWEIIKYNSFG